MDIKVLKRDVEIPSVSLGRTAEFPEWMVAEATYCLTSGKAVTLALPDGPIETRGKDANKDLAALRRAWGVCVEKQNKDKSGRMSLTRHLKGSTVDGKKITESYVEATIWVADKRQYTKTEKPAENQGEKATENQNENKSE